MQKQTLFTTLSALMLAVVACSGDSTDTPTPTLTDGTASPTASVPAEDDERWDQGATWTPISDELLPCGEPIALNPEDDPEAASCISALADKVGPGVADFFEATDQFLFDFEGRPGIDVGRAGAPWFNMGRGELVFLNASPDVIFAAEHVPSNWSVAPQYRDAIGDEPIVAWFEYWSVQSQTTAGNGTESFVIAYPLQECRVCPAIGTLQVRYEFDADRALSAVATQSIGAAPATP